MTKRSRKARSKGLRVRKKRAAKTKARKRAAGKKGKTAIHDYPPPSR